MKNTRKPSGRKVIRLAPRVRLNRRGSGVWRASKWARRIAAFTWEVRSRSFPDAWHMVYVDHGVSENDSGQTIRCRCKFYLFNGTCSHVPYVLELEQRFAKRNPQLYLLELQRKREHPRPAPGRYPGGLR